MDAEAFAVTFSAPMKRTDPLVDEPMLRDELGVPEELFRKDEEKKRVEVAPWVLEEIFPQLPYESFLVEEYPTADRLEVEREPLRPR